MPLVLSLSPDQNWIYPLIKFIPGDLLQRGVYSKVKYSCSSDKDYTVFWYFNVEY